MAHLLWQLRLLHCKVPLRLHLKGAEVRYLRQGIVVEELEFQMEQQHFSIQVAVDISENLPTELLFFQAAFLRYNQFRQME